MPADTPAFWAEWQSLAVEATEIASSRGRRGPVGARTADADQRLVRTVDGRIPIVNQIYRDRRRCATPRPPRRLAGLGGPGGTYAAALPDASGDLVTIRVVDGFHFTPAGRDLQARVTLPAVAAGWATDGGRTVPWRGSCP